MKTKNRKSIATQLFGEIDPNFKRPKPTRVPHTTMVTSSWKTSDGKPRPRKRMGKNS